MKKSKTTPSLPGHGQLLPVVDAERCLDTDRLQDLEQSFRRWVQSSRRPDHRYSRNRILMIFLLIRYTGARLNEVLHLDPEKDFDLDNNTVRFCRERGEQDASCREVQIPEAISADIRTITGDPDFGRRGTDLFRIDPAHIRRKFYEQAAAAGIPQALGAPESIRKSRAVELMQSSVPLPVVQKILGHSTPNLAASYVEFSDEEIRQVARYFADRENRRKTSARNAFFCKISKIRKGDVQAVVEMASPGRNMITAVITNDSLERIGLKPGIFVTAEVKAPWVQLCKGKIVPRCSAENRLEGTVCRITSGRITAEVVVRLLDGTELCAIITEKSRRDMDIQEKETLWVSFDAFAVILHAD